MKTLPKKAAPLSWSTANDPFLRTAFYGTCRALILYLEQHGPVHVNALCNVFGWTQPALSHHLARLRIAGIVTFRRDGKYSFYEIANRDTKLMQLFLESCHRMQDVVEYRRQKRRDVNV